MTEPTLAEAIEKLALFAGAPDPYGWSLDGEPFDLGALVVVVRGQVAALALDVKRWRDQCPVTADHVNAAGVTWGQVLAWVDAHPRDTPELRDVGHHLEHCIRSSEDVAGAINDISRHLARPAHDILAEMAAIEVPT